MIALLFPGQGSQLVGMGKDVAARFPVAADAFAAADDVLQHPLSRLCFEGPEAALNATDVQQPAIFVTSVALLRAAEATGRIRLSDVRALAGLSLGEYTALHVAGALDFADALRLVKCRGQLMQLAAQQHPGGMVSILGLDEPAVEQLCAQARAHGRIGAANFNCPGQIVISGDVAACDHAASIVDSFGGKAVKLPVAGAFHSELMRSAADAFREDLERADFQTPSMRVLSNVNTEDHGEASSIRELLYQQVFRPVRWQACVERLIAGGVSEFFEVGPNRVLTGLMRKISRAVTMRTLGKAEDLAT